MVKRMLYTLRSFMARTRHCCKLSMRGFIQRLEMITSFTKAKSDGKVC